MAQWKDPEVAGLQAMMAAVAPAEGGPARSWPERRAGIDGMGQMAPPPDGCVVESIKLDGVPGEKITPKGADAARTIYYLHGGGYCIGGSASHRTMVAKMALAAGAVAYVIDYRMGPEDPFPAAVDDAVAAWRALLAAGRDPSQADARLARNVAPFPAGLHVISPWVNLTNTGRAYAAKAATDFVLSQAGLDEFRDNYLGKTDPKTPLASPLFADLTGLPPLLIQVGSEEVLLSDATGLAEAAGLANVDVTLRIWANMIHIWPFFPMLSTGAATIAESTAWIRARIG